jgi:putative acetyltransferase
MKDFEVRRAVPADAGGIFAAHVDSICSIGALHYSADIVNDWKSRLKPEGYVKAMASGQVFHVAVDENGSVLGFSSYRQEHNQHRTAVYVRGNGSRRGIGTALFRAAENAAIHAGANTIEVDASLAAIEFYRSNGFEEISRGEHRSPSGLSMACALMQKRLRLATRSDVANTPISE